MLYKKIIIDIFSYLTVIFINFFSIKIDILSLSINDRIIVLLMGLVYICSIINYKGYTQYVEFSNLNQISALLKSVLLTILSTFIILFILSIQFSLLVSFSNKLLFVLTFFSIPIIFRQVFKNIFKYKIKKERIIIFGAGEMGQALSQSLENKFNNRFKLIGFVDDKIKKERIINKYKVLGTADDIQNICIKKNINRVIIAARNINEEKLKSVEKNLFKTNIRINYMPNIESFVTNPRKIKEFSGIPLISKNFNSKSLFYLISKRAFDIIFSIILIILTSPILIFVSFIIYFERSGKIFFTQKRVGLNGELFKIYKFRSMYVDAPKYANCPSDEFDPRVTKIGRWIRKTSIDELPQLINILKGEMSFVGPRPEMSFIVENYNFFEKRRLMAKPGLTGLWQISPYRNSEINHNLEFDFYYIENQSFILDCVILIMTAFFVFRGIAH